MDLFGREEANKHSFITARQSITEKYTKIWVPFLTRETEQNKRHEIKTSRQLPHCKEKSEARSASVLLMAMAHQFVVLR